MIVNKSINILHILLSFIQPCGDLTEAIFPLRDDAEDSYKFNPKTSYLSECEFTLTLLLHDAPFPA